MKRSDRPIIHIGFPKTASTTLQNKFFCELSSVCYLGKPLSEGNAFVEEFLHTITDCETQEYDEERLSLNLKNYSNDVRLIISEETFSTGSSLSGNVSRHEIADRLHSIFPEAKIIIVVREQESAIKSLFLQKMKSAYSSSYSFEAWMEQEQRKDNSKITSIFHLYDYSSLVGLYQERFGVENVRVLAYEQLHHSPISYYKQIAEFCGLKIDSKLEHIINCACSSHENATLTQKQLMIKKYALLFRALGFLVPQGLKKQILAYARKGSKVQVDVSDEQKTFIKKRYLCSNRELEKMTQLPLKKYGYSL